ncbi:metallophosphoesterase [Clostridium sp. PL3]|uniref:Metallophosphoesterase n=1 Tax=Clostridium thailandense TaxID=2794346 RepID=A0A949WU17_9CLOT|nr:metallophosphoesterase [Clostridium thailandense]MBV7272107.1 metallophosphoesterase [Clostridium thailandense]
MTLFDQSFADLQAIKSKRNPDDYNIVFFGDSWVQRSIGSDVRFVSNDIFEVAMQRAMDFNPLLFAYGGDGAFTGTEDNLNFLVEKINSLNKDKNGDRVPFFMVPGNHDAARSNNTLSLDNYKKIIGPEDIHWYIDLPSFRLRLVGLNSLYHYVYKEYGLTESELEFLDNILPYNRCHMNVFVDMHVPPREPQLDWVGEDAFPNERGRKEFYNIVRNRVSKVLLGHIHDFQLAEAHDVKFILSGGGGATLNVCARFHIVVINIRRHGNFNVITQHFVPVGWQRATEPVSP